MLKHRGPCPEARNGRMQVRVPIRRIPWLFLFALATWLVVMCVFVIAQHGVGCFWHGGGVAALVAFLECPKLKSEHVISDHIHGDRGIAVEEWRLDPFYYLYDGCVCKQTCYISTLGHVADSAGSASAIWCELTSDSAGSAKTLV
eukprot:1153303-Pelagomonas_calceolata.AAC.5